MVNTMEIILIVQCYIGYFQFFIELDFVFDDDGDIEFFYIIIV